MSEPKIKRITFCAEPQDVHILEQRQQAFGGASASAIIRMALRKLAEQPTIATRVSQPAVLISRREIV
jgi:hypothetical protein